MIDTTTNDPIAALDRMLAEGYEIWEAAVSIGIADEADMTVRRWRHGDICTRLERKYGEKIVTKYASAVNVASSTMRQRHAMSAYYQLDTRYLFENLGYKHYRDAKRFEDLDVSLRALNKASIRDWPAWKFESFVTRALGKPARAEAVTGKYNGTLAMLIDCAVIEIELDKVPNDWQPGDKVSIRRLSK